MKRFAIYLVFLWMSNCVLGQNKDSVNYIRPADIMPEYPGGSEKLLEIINQNLKYPDSAKNDRIEGTVIVTFVIDTSGNVSKIKLLRGIREDLNQEAIRVAGLLQGWAPGLYKNKKVCVQNNLPIRFQLYNSK